MRGPEFSPRRAANSLATVGLIALSALGCNGGDSSGRTTGTPGSQPQPTAPSSPSSPAAPAQPNNPTPPSAPTTPSVPSIPSVPSPTPRLQLPMIFGFSQPADVLNPSAFVENQITEQARLGITEVPIYAGGNVTPDGRELTLSGQTPDLAPFMAMLARIETTLGLPANTLKVRPYIRASLTAADATANPNGPGRISLNNTTTRASLITLLNSIVNGQKYGLDAARVEEFTLDFEDLTASNYDQNDLAAGDEGSVTQMGNFIEALKQSGFAKKIGLVCTGFATANWFPAETTQPYGSPFQISPRNFISSEDGVFLFRKGLDTLEVDAYSIFPLQGGAGGFADPIIYGPIHADYDDFVAYQYRCMANITAAVPGRTLNSGNIRLVIPTFAGTEIVSTATAIQGLQEVLRTQVGLTIRGAAFDFGSTDANERQAILDAQR